MEVKQHQNKVWCCSCVL